MLTDYVEWYKHKFGATQPEWYVFPFGKPQPTDPTRHVTTLKTVWNNIREKAEVKGRWHDNRHTLMTELAESGAGDQTIMDIAGHVSKQMLKHYSHIRMEAKRKALESMVKKPAGKDAMGQQNGQAEGSRQKSLQGSRMEPRRPANDHSIAQPRNRCSKKNGTALLRIANIAQHFEAESPQKSLQSGIFEGHRGVRRA